MKSSITEIFSLEISEKLQLVEALWDDIAKHPESLPVPDWQKSELKKRKANARRHPEAGVAWEDVKRRIQRRHA